MILDNVYQCSSELTESSEMVEILTDIAENPATRAMHGIRH